MLTYLETSFFGVFWFFLQLGRNTRFGGFGEQTEEAGVELQSGQRERSRRVGMVLGVRSYVRGVWSVGSGPAAII